MNETFSECVSIIELISALQMPRSASLLLHRVVSPDVCRAEILLSICLAMLCKHTHNRTLFISRETQNIKIHFLAFIHS